MRTERSVALEVEFDASSCASSLIRRICTNCFLLQGYKLVTISVAEATRLEKMSEAQKSSLRDAALWYLSVPNVDLCLNEASFTGEPPSAFRYRPLLESRKVYGSGTWLSLRPLQCEVIRDWLTGAEVKLGRVHLISNPKPLRFHVDGRGGEIIRALTTTSERITKKGVELLEAWKAELDCNALFFRNGASYLTYRLYCFITDHNKLGQILSLSIL